MRLYRMRKFLYPEDVKLLIVHGHYPDSRRFNLGLWHNHRVMNFERLTALRKRAPIGVRIRAAELDQAVYRRTDEALFYVSSWSPGHWPIEDRRRG